MYWACPPSRGAGPRAGGPAGSRPRCRSRRGRHASRDRYWRRCRPRSRCRPRRRRAPLDRPTTGIPAGRARRIPSNAWRRDAIEQSRLRQRRTRRCTERGCGILVRGPAAGRRTPRSRHLIEPVGREEHHGIDPACSSSPNGGSIRRPLGRHAGASRYRRWKAGTRGSRGRQIVGPEDVGTRHRTRISRPRRRRRSPRSPLPRRYAPGTDDGRPAPEVAESRAYGQSCHFRLTGEAHDEEMTTHHRDPLAAPDRSGESRSVDLPDGILMRSDSSGAMVGACDDQVTLFGPVLDRRSAAGHLQWGHWSRLEQNVWSRCANAASSCCNGKGCSARPHDATVTQPAAPLAVTVPSPPSAMRRHAQCTLSPLPVPARGVAMARRLLSDGTGPLYNRNRPVSSSAALRSVTVQLDPGTPPPF